MECRIVCCEIAADKGDVRGIVRICGVLACEFDGCDAGGG